MKFAVDIGNSTVAFALFDGKDKLLEFFKIKKDEIEEPYIAIDHIKAEIISRNIDANKIKNIYISSVVPSATKKISSILSLLASCPIDILKPGMSKLVDANSVSSELGSDIYANAVAARFKHPDKDLLVVDFGTATTITGVDKNGKILGVSIASGIFTSLNAISSKAELLNNIILEKPCLTLGKNTKESLVSGALFSAMGMLSVCIEKSRPLFSSSPFVLATGGASLLIKDECSLINEYSEYNTVLGIIKCFE